MQAEFLSGIYSLPDEQEGLSVMELETGYEAHADYRDHNVVPLLGAHN